MIIPVRYAKGEADSVSMLLSMSGNGIEVVSLAITS
jgi:hypothetical protein